MWPGKYTEEKINKILMATESTEEHGKIKSTRNLWFIRHAGEGRHPMHWKLWILAPACADDNDPDHSEGEERFILMGMSVQARLLIVCHCERESDIIRIYSFSPQGWQIWAKAVRRLSTCVNHTTFQNPSRIHMPNGWRSKLLSALTKKRFLTSKQWQKIKESHIRAWSICISGIAQASIGNWKPSGHDKRGWC